MATRLAHRSLAELKVARRLGSIRGAAVTVLLPTIGFILHDLVFQLPDNQGEASLGFFLTVIGLLFIWGGSGYLTAGQTRNRGTAVVAGAFAGILSVAILWTAFVVLNDLFIDRMSYEPDRLLAFQRSGYATMREYWSHQQGAGPFPIVMAAAALAGAIGGAISPTRTRRPASSTTM